MNMKPHWLSRVGVGAVLCGALLMPRSHAAEPPTPGAALGVNPADAAEAHSAPAALAEVIVTAEDRRQSLQDTTFSGVVLTGHQLADQGKTNIDSALADVPAVRMEGSANGAQIFIRGVGSDADSQLGDPAVSLNVDGIYQQETEAVTSAMFDVKRIEVLRGPQGTLYGQNATAGVVNVITNDPLPGVSRGSARIEVGNYQEFAANAMANVPLSNALTLRVALMSRRHNGYLSNGNDNGNTKAGRVKLLWQPGENWRVLWAASYEHLRDHDFGTVEAPLNNVAPFSSNKPAGYRDLYSWNTLVKIDYSFQSATVTLLAGHNGFGKSEANVLLGLAPSVADRRDGRQTSVELRAVSAPRSRVQWVGGLYYMTDDEGRRVIPSLISVPAAPAANPELRVAGSASYAAYADVTVPLPARLQVEGGVRVTRDIKSARYVFIDGSGLPDVRPSRSWNSFTYKAVLEEKLSRRSMVYGKVSSGFKAGGYSQQFPANTYDPEKILAYEIGSKNEWLHRRLIANGSIWYYDYKDYQASYPDIVGGAFALVTSNAASATLYGAELETRWRATRRDTFSLGWSFIHSRFGRFVYTSVLTGPVNHSDQQLPNAPVWSADVGYSHVFELNDGATVTGSLTSHLTHGYWTTVERTLDSYQTSFTRTDAYLMYTSASGVWRVRVFGKNLEGTAVRTLGLANPFDAVLMLAPPRTYGLSVSADF